MGLVGAATAWPLAARAQQQAMRRIAVLQGGGDKDNPRTQRNIAAFLKAMQQLGWTDGCAAQRTHARRRSMSICRFCSQRKLNWSSISRLPRPRYHCLASTARARRRGDRMKRREYIML